MRQTREHKDRFFKKLFSEKKDLLSLYNAINHTDYSDPEAIEINTIEDFIFMNMKNDLSFVVANMMNLYEQQSSPNPNMPLRGFGIWQNCIERSFLDIRICIAAGGFRYLHRSLLFSISEKRTNRIKRPCL